jgi:hypothetical protein
MILNDQIQHLISGPPFVAARNVFVVAAACERKGRLIQIGANRSIRPTTIFLDRYERSSRGHPWNVEIFPRSVPHAVPSATASCAWIDTGCRRLKAKRTAAKIFMFMLRKFFFMRSEQMPVRPERGLGFKVCPAPPVDLFPGERAIENEGTTGDLPALAGSLSFHRGCGIYFPIAGHSLRVYKRRLRRIALPIATTGRNAR